MERLEPFNIPQTKFGERILIRVQRVNEIVKGNRGITEDTVLRLAAALRMSSAFWLNLQQRWNLYHAMRSESAKEIARIKPIKELARS